MRWAEVLEAMLMRFLGVGKWCTDHAAQEYAASHQCNEQGNRMGASAGTEGLRHLWAVQEGD